MTAAISGKSIRVSEIRTPPVVEVEAGVVDRLQAEMEAAAGAGQLQLEGLYPPVRPNRFLRENLLKWLDALPLSADENKLLKKIYDEYVEMVRYEELRAGIRVLAADLRGRIKGPYAISYDKDKSSEWMAAQAIPLMEKAPVGYINSFNPVVPKGCRTVVHFDDMSLSGAQIAMYADFIAEQAKEPLEVLYAVPFISSKAIAVWAKNPIATSVEGVSVDLLTTTRRLRAQEDVMSEEERTVFEELQNKLVRTGIFPGEYAWGDVSGSGFCLSTTEWKTPDWMSFPKVLLGDKDAPAITDHCPVYRS